MKCYVIPISTTLLLFGCQLRTPTDQQASTPAGTSAAPARDVLQSHFGCTDTAEWTKCSAHTSEDACFGDQCNGANGQCLPADGNCSQYTAESECTADSACTFFMPTDAACADKCALIDSEEACSRTPSCTWLGYFGCVSPGDAQCAVLDRPDTCAAAGTCESSWPSCWADVSCDQIYSQSECEGSTLGCTWWDTWGCGPTTCWEVYDEGTCNGTTGCGWLEDWEYCDEAEVARCSAVSLDQCDSTSGCATWVECTSAEEAASCWALTVEECGTQSHCTVPGRCTSACYPAQTDTECEAVTGTSCTWQEVLFRTGGQFRCTTACHEVNAHLPGR